MKCSMLLFILFRAAIALACSTETNASDVPLGLDEPLIEIQLGKLLIYKICW